jgi:hypothetical protein
MKIRSLRESGAIFLSVSLAGFAGHPRRVKMRTLRESRAIFPLVLLARGGWRNWRGVAVFGLVVLLVAQPGCWSRRTC